MDKESNGYKALFALNKSLAIAQTIIAAESAAAQVLAHDAGILGLGAIATSNIVRGMGYASAGVIAGTAMAGGRQYGGPTNSGSNYRINETGTPEIYSEGGKDYLMNSGGGKVTPMDKMEGGGGGDVNVTVVNNGAPASARVERIGPKDVKIVLDALSDQVNRGQGNFVKSMKQSSNFQTKSGGR